jgi:hypothetical protein
MDGAFAAGLVTTLAGAVGYAAGMATPYPGRAFSVTALMIGITLLAIGTWGRTDDPASATDGSDTSAAGGSHR